ncbi:hypothetical protein WUBG_07998 [Wuchereria bancrofti]|uniref:Uncharacterized protein n=1 Tax=Wuchereria bancrofti TaxID=6293 RepID=J9EG33_WUCBA|nr:hypothetical protein WUBG_07998 [Wuchereria bancrofti]
MFTSDKSDIVTGINVILIVPFNIMHDLKRERIFISKYLYYPVNKANDPDSMNHPVILTSAVQRVYCHNSRHNEVKIKVTWINAVMMIWLVYHLANLRLVSKVEF